MAHAIRMPALGQSSDEMKLVQWFKPVGTHVDEGEPLFEAESDKTTLEVEAAATGTLLQVACQPGEIVASGTVIAWLGEPGEALPSTSAATSEAPAPANIPAAVETRRPSPDGRVQATPAARTLAREHRIELSGLTGTGPDGRIERRDVQEVIDKQGSAGSATAGSEGWRARRPQRRARSRCRPTANSSLGAWPERPWCLISPYPRPSTPPPCGRLAAEVEGLTITHMLLQAVSAALLEHPALDRTWNEAGPSYRRLGRGDVGVAVAAGDNLIVASSAMPGQAQPGRPGAHRPASHSLGTRGPVDPGVRRASRRHCEQPWDVRGRPVRGPDRPGPVRHIGRWADPGPSWCDGRDGTPRRPARPHAVGRPPGRGRRRGGRFSCRPSPTVWSAPTDLVPDGDEPVRSFRGATVRRTSERSGR